MNVAAEIVGPGGSGGTLTKARFESEARKHCCLRCSARPVVSMIRRVTTAGKHVVEIEQWLCASCTEALGRFLMPTLPAEADGRPDALGQLLGRRPSASMGDGPEA